MSRLVRTDIFPFISSNDGLSPTPETEVVRFDGVGVRYRLGSRRDVMKARVMDTLLKRQAGQDVWALRDVDLTCYSGELIGIIGSNGAGKTTLCRVVSGLLRPDQGRARVSGSVSSLFSLGTGFRRDLTGRENIYLNGMMLGFKKRDLAAMMEAIIEFTELEAFIDQPLKRYSSGMRSRLGFSIGAMLTPDILVLDEALSAGDLSFSEKAGKKLQELIHRAKLVLMVTHNLDFVEKYCSRALWMEKGRIRDQGLPADIIAHYLDQQGVLPKKRPLIQLPPTAVSVGEVEVARTERLGIRYLLDKAPAEEGGGAARPLKGMSRAKDLWALHDISFRIMEGEILGVIGPNAAGKTTLCRALCGILKPDAGHVRINGRITALLTFGAGFRIELSGNDNIYLNGLMLGLTKKEIDGLCADIVGFSGISQRFIEQPVKHYSAGMRARLGFSIVSMIKPDIFIVDEALNAGDAAFYEKAGARIQELIREAKAAVIVSHNIGFIEKICTRALVLHKGEVLFDGPPGAAVSVYREQAKSGRSVSTPRGQP
jgi:teichoic acid transport system ATP-binding protein